MNVSLNSILPSFFELCSKANHLPGVAEGEYFDFQTRPAGGRHVMRSGQLLLTASLLPWS